MYYLRESIDRPRLKREGMLKEEGIKEEIYHDGDGAHKNMCTYFTISPLNIFVL